MMGRGGRALDSHHVFTCLSTVLAEGAHEHHHLHASLARRPGLDWPYHVFIRPLQAARLVWNVRVGVAKAE